MEEFSKELLLIQKKMSKIEYICVGSINKVYTVCGKKYCDCKKDPSKRHGPYFLWTRKIDGKTKSKYLSKAQVVFCKKLIKNHDYFLKLIDSLKKVSEKAIDSLKD
jgi:hypothetical protein